MIPLNASAQHLRNVILEPAIAPSQLSSLPAADYTRHFLISPILTVPFTS
jgi:hypothetical protein